MNVQELSPAVINGVVLSGGKQTFGLNAEEVSYLLQLDRAATLLQQGESSMLEIARQLQRENPKMSLRTCRRRVDDAVKYLYTNSSATAQNWNEFYAEKMERLALGAENAGDLKTAAMCYQRARDYRIEAAVEKVDPERVKFKPMIVSPDVMPERLGLNKGKTRDLLQAAEQFIKRTDLPEKEKERLMRETEMEAGS